MSKLNLVLTDSKFRLWLADNKIPIPLHKYEPRSKSLCCSECDYYVPLCWLCYLCQSCCEFKRKNLLLQEAIREDQREARQLKK
jgi:hypothetical protein